jgi:hypothetical protein
MQITPAQHALALEVAVDGANGEIASYAASTSPDLLPPIAEVGAAIYMNDAALGEHEQKLYSAFPGNSSSVSSIMLAYRGAAELGTKMQQPGTTWDQVADELGSIGTSLVNDAKALDPTLTRDEIDAALGNK